MPVELSIDQISADCGFGNAVTLRQNFAAGLLHDSDGVQAAV
ncbi:hypothetical protein [Pseudarthrobacter sp. NamE5]|nr:hypothetical protein [Pseudarthrobacter sp. NamE5]